MTVAALYVERGGIGVRIAKHVTLGESGCHLWMGSKDRKGYGRIFVGSGKSPAFTHRASWALFNGEIPDGLCVLHRCDVPSCCNPEHLFLGTVADNNADMDSKGRARRGAALSARTHCANGHALVDNNVRLRRGGGRACRACSREWQRRKRSSQ